MHLDMEKFMKALPIMGNGFLGVFIVTAVIILSVILLRELTKPRGQ